MPRSVHGCSETRGGSESESTVRAATEPPARWCRGGGPHASVWSGTRCSVLVSRHPLPRTTGIPNSRGDLLSWGTNWGRHQIRARDFPSPVLHFHWISGIFLGEPR